MIYSNSISLTDWTASGERNQDINFDIRSTPLQIQADSDIGSGHLIWPQFFDTATSQLRGISIYLKSPPIFSIGYCTSKAEIPLNKLGSDKNRIWTIVIDSTRIKLSCNGELIIDYDAQLSSNQECREKWSFGASNLRFGDNFEEMDNASDFYREYTTGKEILNLRQLGLGL